MKAKFDTIMLPIGKTLIAADQQSHLSFDAFFQNTMFHEVAHGLGIKNTLDGEGTVREALKDQASSRSKEHTSELQSLMRISYAVFCLKKKKKQKATYSKYQIQHTT